MKVITTQKCNVKIATGIFDTTFHKYIPQTFSPNSQSLYCYITLTVYLTSYFTEVFSSQNNTQCDTMS